MPGAVRLVKEIYVSCFIGGNDMIKHTFLVVSLLTIAPIVSAVPSLPTTFNTESLKEYYNNLRAPEFFDAETCANAALVYVSFKGLEKLYRYLTRSSSLFPEDLPTTVEKNSNNITTLQTTLGKVDAAVIHNTESITTLASVVQGTKGKQEGVVRRVDILEKRVDALEGRATDYETQFNGKVEYYNKELASVEKRLKGLQRNVASIDDRHAQEDAEKAATVKSVRTVSMSNPAVTRSTGPNAITGRIAMFDQSDHN